MTQGTTQGEEELETDFRRYLELALTPIFDVCKVKQDERDGLFEAVVAANMISVKRFTEQELTKARLDELEHIKFIDDYGKELFQPFNQYRYSDDHLLLNWDDREKMLTTQLKKGE